MRLCACDFDGTLLRGGRVLESDLEAIRAWRGRGNLFALATGRGHYTLDLALSGIPGLVCDYLVCNNGALVLDAKANVLFESTLETASVRKIFASAAFKEAQACAVFHGKKMSLLAGKECGHWRRVAQHLSSMGVDEVEAQPLLQMSLGWKTRDESFFWGRVLAKNLESLARVELSLTLADIVPLGAGKLGGVRRLLSLLALDESAVVAIGDDGNDVDMLKFFEGYAVEGSPSFVADAAGRTAQSVGSVLSSLL